MPTKVTRRCVCGLLLGELFGTVACAWSSESVATALQKYASEQNLVLLDSRVLPYGDHGELNAFTLAGDFAGKVVVPGDPYAIAVSPDGAWLAWDNMSALPWPEGAGEPLQVSIASAPQSVRTLHPKASSGRSLAISSRAEHIALIVNSLGGNGGGPRLVVLKAATCEVEHDLTDVVPESYLHQANWLRSSGPGNRLVVASLKQFVVIDVPSHKVVMEEEGDWPALSPDGESLAFVDDQKRLVVVSLPAGIRRILSSGGGKTIGIGTWSPNGKFLLANFAVTLGESLVAVDCATDRYAEVKFMALKGGIRGVWAKRDLIQPLEP